MCPHVHLYMDIRSDRRYSITMPNHLTIAQMAEHIRGRKLSSVELVNAHLKQIERHNPQLNAFVSVFAEQALEAARKADEQLPGGPLHGVPVTIKDCFDMAGEPTYCGSRYRLNHRATSDSTAVARFRAAGAIPI